MGVFDPLLSTHLNLFAELRGYAQQRGLRSLAFLIDPDPASLIYGRSDWPVFDDRESRVRLILGAGIDGMVLLRFYRQDLFAVAADFFNQVTPQVEMAELWLGARQNIGSGPESAAEIVEQLAESHRISIRRLERVAIRQTTFEVRQRLTDGSVRRAADIVGRFPRRVRPRTGTLRLAWKPGPYEAVVDDSSNDSLLGRRVQHELVEDGWRLARAMWPKHADALSFVAGPLDLAESIGSHVQLSQEPASVRAADILHRRKEGQPIVR
jgi:hypothetical protein